MLRTSGEFAVIFVEFDRAVPSYDGASLDADTARAAILQRYQARTGRPCPVDAWGNRIEIVPVITEAMATISLRSPGADGVLGTGDDIIDRMSFRRCGAPVAQPGEKPETQAVRSY